MYSANLKKRLGKPTSQIGYEGQERSTLRNSAVFKSRLQRDSLVLK
jgi:hypothetical protein